MACFKQLQTGAPAVSNLQLHENEDGFVVAGFLGRKAYTFLLSQDFLTNQKLRPSRCTFQEYTIQDEILFLYKLSEKYYIVDCKGCIHNVGSNTSDDDTGDIFDDSPQSEKCAGEVKMVAQADVGRAEVVAACLIRNDSLALLSYSVEQSCCVLTLHSLATFETLQTLTIRNNVMSLPKTAFMVYADDSEVEEHFVKNWFPHFGSDRTNPGYLFIFNCQDAICAVQLSQPSEVGFFFSWPYPAVFASFKAKIKDQTAGWTCLLLAFEDGAIVRLSAAGGQTLHFASRPTICAEYAGPALLTSDNSDCQVVPLDVGEPYVHPVKGIIALCAVRPSSSHVLALSNFGGLYLLNLTDRVDGKKRTVPELSCFQETVNNIAHLEELNVQIAAQDRAINCLAIAQNCKNFVFRLDVQVVRILSDDHVFRVTCQHLPGEGAAHAALAVGAQDWHLSLTLALGARRLVHVQRLSRDFTTAEPLDTMVRLAFGEECASRDVVADVALIAFPNDGKYCPVLPLGKVRLDVLSFIEPENSLSIHSALTSKPKFDRLSDVLQSHKLDTFDKAKNRETKDWKVLIKLPTVTSPAGGVSSFEKIASKSQALWRLESWKNMCGQKRWSVAVSGRKITFEVKDGHLELSGDDLSLVVQLKHAILRLDNQSPKLLTISDEKPLIVAEGLLKKLEIMEFSPEELTAANVFEIYSLKMKLLNDQFYDTVFRAN